MAGKKPDKSNAEASGPGSLMEEIRGCRICVERPSGRPLPHEPRPVAILSPTARIAICGQAPGTRVHASGVPFTDPSGDRLRDWMGIGSEAFYDASRLAIVPMGFCFPGLDAKGGDLPPRRECAGQWRSRIFEAMPQIELVLAVGLYAQKWHLGAAVGDSLTATVANWRAILSASREPAILPLPHPSWRNNAWIRKNPWFENDLLPELKKRVRQLL
ncbi:MAG: uracil-DNA glycosylase family protein [Nitratireductor sp.]|nr:uracil-DNA glycosylase family protein [Nitratireductor sp.]